MSWGAVAGAAVGVVGGALSGGGGGGGGETTQTPFFPAIPGMVRNANRAAELEGQYNAEPFNPQQLAAINNLYGQSDYMRQLVPGLLQQMQGQQVGFDRNNPTARPQAWNFGLLGGQGGGAASPQAGLLASPNIGESGGSALGLTQSGVRNTAPGIGAQDHRPISEQPAPAPAAPAPAERQYASQAFTQARDPWNSFAAPSGLKALGGALPDELMQHSGGGYGGFQYGMDMKDIAADPRLEADARMYFAMGGNDPYDVYGGQYMAADRRRALQDQAAADRLWNQP